MKVIIDNFDKNNKIDKIGSKWVDDCSESEISEEIDKLNNKLCDEEFQKEWGYSAGSRFELKEI